MPKVIISALALHAAKVFITNRINDIMSSRDCICQNIPNQINQIWGQDNSDNIEFNQRMQEMQTDINLLIQDLDEYNVLLQQTADRFEQDQQWSRQQFGNLQRPRS
jgi:hypothetical protein